MGRKIVLCCDGTNNRYAATNTNVVKLFAAVDRSQSDQFGYYQPGIGTLTPPGVWGKTRKWIVTRLDLAIAWLLEEHVTAAYRYLMRYYRAGDEIFIFGFSRGAYTARALAAMLYKVGLLSPGNEELLPFAWDTFKGERNPEIYGGFRDTFCQRVSVRFLGLWDTVGSVGWAWNPEYLQYTKNNPGVEVVRHAVALDERRAYFLQNLWTDTPSPGQDVQQVWFPGVHSDVGGGYDETEAGLSKIALKWMVEQTRGFGLRFDESAANTILPTRDTKHYAAPDAAGTMHESLHGWWWIAEYFPKKYRDPLQGFASRLILHRGRRRHVFDGAKVHDTVFERMERVPSYKPTNLPQQVVRVS